MFYAQDIRYAIRQLGRNPAFTALTVLVLAGGLALAIFTFAFLYMAMLKPLPLPGGDRIVRVMQSTDGRSTGSIDAADLAAIRTEVTTLTGIGAFQHRPRVLDGEGAARSVSVISTEWNMFQTTRTPPLVGRGLTADDQLPGAEPVIVLTYATWQAVFGGDESIVGELIGLNGTATRVVGVMPRGYAFPVAAGAYVPIRAELLTAGEPGGERVEVYARLAPGIDRDRASTELTGLLRRVLRQRPSSGTEAPSARALVVSTFQLSQIGDQAPLIMVVLNLLAAMILLLACVNVANLLLARANERARELAVRLALGASRMRLIVQMSWESVLLGAAGGLLATVLAVWGLNAVDTWAATVLEGNLAFWWVWGYDHSVLVAAGVFVTAVVVVLACVSARRAARTQINAVLNDLSSHGGGRSEGRVVRALIIAQVVAVSLVMYFGTASALLASRIVNVDFGYDTTGLSRADLSLPAERYATADARGRFYERLFDVLSGSPELGGVVLRSVLSDVAGPAGVLEIGEAQDGVIHAQANLLASLGPLSTLGIGLLEGRQFDGSDNETGPRTALVSQAMAERYWPGRSPVGERVRLTGLGETEQRTIVGVVEDVLLGNPFDKTRSSVGVYVPLRQTETGAVSVEFRQSGSQSAATTAYERALADLDPLIVSEVSSFDELLEKTTALASSVTRILGLCFVVALLLAVSGTYGLMARSITRRVREIGIRRALGASDSAIAIMLLGQGARQYGIGALIALPFALMMGWGLSSLFPLPLSASIGAAVLVAVVVAAVVLAATWLPARRATAVPPQKALTFQ